MKFKLLFVLFNVVLGLSFLFLFFMPLPVLGWDAMLHFWTHNWYVAVVFLVVLGGLDAYFIANWKMFSLLEREDWKSLFEYLEKLRERKIVLGVQQTKLYVNACLILQRPSAIDKLRRDYVSRKVKSTRSIALLLGLPLILEGRSSEIKTFLEPVLQAYPRHHDAGWLRWAVAFAQLIDQEWSSAKENLFLLVADTRQPVLQLLSLYLLDNLRERDEEVPKVLDPLTVDLKARLTDHEWKKNVESLKERVVLILFMSKLIDDARSWLSNFKSN